MCTTGCSKFSAVYQNEKVALTPHEEDVKFDVNYQNHYLQKNTCIISSNIVLLNFLLNISCSVEHDRITVVLDVMIVHD